MGQKVHPYGFRLGYSKTWRSRWYAAGSYRDSLHEDLQLRRLLKRRLYHAGISKVDIERPGNKLNIYIHTSRPGIIIGRKGTEGEKLSSTRSSSPSPSRSSSRSGSRSGAPCGGRSRTRCATAPRACAFAAPGA